MVTRYTYFLAGAITTNDLHKTFFFTWHHRCKTFGAADSSDIYISKRETSTLFMHTHRAKALDTGPHLLLAEMWVVAKALCHFMFYAVFYKQTGERRATKILLWSLLFCSCSYFFFSMHLYFFRQQPPPRLLKCVCVCTTSL